MQHKPFCHLHLHTEFSMLDGLGTIDEYVDRASKLNMPAMAITDHGVLLGCPTFYKACRKANIEPILGCEFYYVDDVTWRPAKGESPPERYHLILLARGERGYQVLTRLNTIAAQNYYYKPVIDRAILADLSDEDREHLVALSGCASSKLSEYVKAEQMDKAVEELTWWRETFPHYYIELQHHDTDFDCHLTEGLISLAQRYHVPMVATNDPHYVVRQDAPHHDALLAIQVAKDIDDPNRFRFDGHGYHLRSRLEMRRAFRRYGDEVWREAARNTLRIAWLCRTRIPQWEQREWQIPVYPDVPDGLTSFQYLRRLVRKELRTRGLDGNPAYVESANTELKVIKDTGISDFLLITMDFIRFARSVGIPVGPGRGSVCGSLVGWLLDIHRIDPIRYNLLFERFLNPARPSMPDIDTDFGKLRRGEMFEYVTEKYGAENVIHVCTYGTMKLKKAFQSLAGAYGIGFADRMRLSKLIEQDEDDESQFTLPDEIETKYPDLHAQLQRLAGTKCQVSAHPAGVIIAAPEVKLADQVPLMYIASSKRMVGQYDLYAAEATGLMKQDFLGLRALDTVAEAVRLVEQRTGVRLDPDAWIPDEEPGDRDIYKMCRRGETEGVFQFEGFTNRRGCKAVKPKSFEDLVSITALYRTGPIKAGYPARFIESRKAGKVEWSHPSLEQFLATTWGVILYQEQVMDIAHHIAGFDMAGVDDIKNAIKHKDAPTLLAMERPFMDGCRDTGIVPAKVAKELWEAIREYSGYNYNRSHAVAYTMLSYQTARLSALYPAEFFAALLGTVEPTKDNTEKRTSYLQTLVRRGFKVLPPHINLSDEHAKTNRQGTAVRFGFWDLAGIGPSAAAKIVAGRPEGGYESVEQVEAAVKNAGVMKVLAESGTMSRLGVEGDDAVRDELLRWQIKDEMLRYRMKYADYLNPPETAYHPDDVTIIGQVVSKASGRTKAGDKQYQTWQINMSQTQTYRVRLWSETAKVWSIPVGSVVLVNGRFESKWDNISVASPSQVKVVSRAS